MTLSEYALGLQPFFSYLKTDAEYFVALIGNFLKDGAMDGCPLLTVKKDTRYRFLIGSHPIPRKSAKYTYEHRDHDKYVAWVNERLEETDSYSDVEEWLKSKGQPGYDVAEECAQLLEQILIEKISESSSPVISVGGIQEDLKRISEIEAMIAKLPRPKEVPVPPNEASEERIYIDELLLAYGDAVEMQIFTEADFDDYPDYADDLDDRRIDFYAAETIKRGVLELGKGELSGQFRVLMDETLSRVKDVARGEHKNGYERMLAVMNQAAIMPLENYLLSASPYWISGNIKKGVCHHLVNARRLKWVRGKRS